MIHWINMSAAHLQAAVPLLRKTTISAVSKGATYWQKINLLFLLRPVQKSTHIFKQQTYKFEEHFIYFFIKPSIWTVNHALYSHITVLNVAVLILQIFLRVFKSLKFDF